MSAPSQEEVDDIVLACRYGELDEVKAFVEEHGWEALARARDERGNTVLHMCCGNGHVDVLELLVRHVPPSMLSTVNDAGSPPIHWAILNNHVSCVKLLAELPAQQGGGLPLLQKNGAGRDAFMESVFAGEGKEEVSGWIEGFLFRAEGGTDDEEAAADGVGREDNANSLAEQAEVLRVTDQ